MKPADVYASDNAAFPRGVNELSASSRMASILPTTTRIHAHKYFREHFEPYDY